jgi:hypothetical protein
MSKLQFLPAGLVAATMLATPALAHENHVKSQRAQRTLRSALRLEDVTTIIRTSQHCW